MNSVLCTKEIAKGGRRNKLIRAIPLFLLIGLVGAIVYGYLDNPLMQQMITEAALSRLQPITDADNGKTVSVKQGRTTTLKVLKPDSRNKPVETFVITVSVMQ